MKLSSYNLPRLFKEKTGVYATSEDRYTFSRNLADGRKIENLPVIHDQSSSLRNNNGQRDKTRRVVQGTTSNMGTKFPKMQSPPVARMTTTFRESYRGLYGPPAPSMKRRDSLPDPFRVGSSSYTVDFASKPLRQRTPPSVRQGNVLNSYPGNVLYPYTLPEQVITIWKPFPVQKSDSVQTDEILARLSRKMYRTSYQLDFTKSGTPVIPD